MLIAVFGDIHGNIDALLSVLSALSEAGVDRMFCTGDIVGYGASPGACIDTIGELGIPCVKGNHDDYTSQVEQMDWGIRPDAKEAILWSRKKLSRNHVSWLSALPYMLEEEDFTIVHASHTYLPHWPYVLNERAAIHNVLFQSRSLAFNGHSHVPVYLAHRRHHRPRLDLLHNILLPRRQKVMIGVGAVGQPRDSDPRACAVLYDTDVKSIRVIRVAYDIATAQKRIRRAGLPPELAARLELGQ